jgi:hypothetical protein
MKIEMKKRKGGIYAHWYELLYRDTQGRIVRFLIWSHQANTYAKAVRFFYASRVKNCTTILLRNSEPFDEGMHLAC